MSRGPGTVQRRVIAALKGRPRQVTTLARLVFGLRHDESRPVRGAVSGARCAAWRGSGWWPPRSARTAETVGRWWTATTCGDWSWRQRAEASAKGANSLLRSMRAAGSPRSVAGAG
jgi:hypothetical protein